MNSRISPVPDAEQLTHNRTYDIESYRIDSNTLRLRGRVTDAKTPGLFVADDPEPLDVHDMIVDLTIGRRLDGAPVWIRDRLAKLGRSSKDSNW